MAQSVSAARAALAIPLTSFVGRETEIAALRALWRRANVRWVTLTGPGGVGKTRLAQQSAADSVSRFADGVFFVPLAAIRQSEWVLPTVARSLALTQAAGQSPLAALTAYLADRQLLLLLDNFEQLLPAAPQLAELLAACPDLHLLVTSREALRVRGEHEFPVQPLAESPAVALFVERVQARQPDFAPAAEDAPLIAEICARVDGLPLGIELAAARLNLYPPAALLKRLGRRLETLRVAARDMPARHQTLRSAIGWSYDLLEAAEQRLFRRLSVFVGGCSLEAAGQLDEPEVELRVASLLEKNLLRRAPPLDDEPRLVMLETVREYALERLAASGEAAAARRAHAIYYAGWAEAIEPRLMGSQQRRWLEHLEAEHDNLRAALQWALDQREADVALRLGSALWRFWFWRGYLSEGRRWLDLALTVSGRPDPAVRVKALVGAGFLAANQSDYRRAEALCGEGLQLAQQLGDKPSLALALFGLASTANWGRDHARARALFEQSLALYRELGDAWGCAAEIRSSLLRARQAGPVCGFGIVPDEVGPVIEPGPLGGPAGVSPG